MTRYSTTGARAHFRRVRRSAKGASSLKPFKRVRASMDRGAALSDGVASALSSFRQIARDAPAMIWICAPDGSITFLSQYSLDYAGLTPREALGFGWLAAVHADDRERTIQTLLQGIAEQKPFSNDFRLCRHDGVYHWMMNTAAPTFSVGGRYEGHVGTVVDIEERKQEEQYRDLLRREVDHRAKNALAVASSIVRLTRAVSIGAYVDAVEARIAAMARAHALLASRRWTFTPLRALLDSELGAMDPQMARTTLEGPDVDLDPDAVQPVTLLLHEMATNALKHGGYASASGHVAVRWWVDATGALTIHRSETAGKPIAPPQATGFGHDLMEAVAVKQMRSRLSFDWPDHGLQMTVEVPAAVWSRQGRSPVLASRVGLAAEPKDIAAGTPAILVVEDDILIAESLQDMLAEIGIKTLGPAFSVEQALALLGELQPHAVLLDANLNREDAAPVAEALKARGIPFAWCTGYAGETLRQFDAQVLAKPVTRGRLSETVHRLLGL